MTFASVDYALFLVAVGATYWLLPTRGQNALLLVASWAFYGWVHPAFLAVLGGVTVVSWACAWAIEARPERRRTWLALAALTTLGALAVFKYLGFFVDNAAAVLGALGLSVSRPALELLLPVGLSFYTFQGLGYVADVYRGEVRARRDPAVVALFLAFFPQLVAGPIERAHSLLAQIERPRRLAPERAEAALVLLAWGFFKKLVVADQLAFTVDRVFALRDASFPLLAVATYAFALQIYADFSAYSDIARGSARLLGFELVRNFDTPYLATSPGDFWRRWHVSLTTFFRDYVYLPLAGPRPSAARAGAALVATFGLSGLWHGAGWNYVLWGLYHGLLLLLERAWARSRGAALLAGPAWALPKGVATFALVGVGLAIFRETGGIAWIAHDLTDVRLLVPAEDAYVARYLGVLALLYTGPVWAWDAVERWRRASPSRPVPFAARAALVPALVVATYVLAPEKPLSFVYFAF